MIIRAVHIEVLSSLETGAFLAGFFRFIARRGCPLKVFSDNGTNLVGVHNELSRSLRQLNRSQVVCSTRRRGVEWVFNPPSASHQGGIWERMIRTVRRVLCALLDHSTRLTDDVLVTVMCDAENLVNSRPITKCSDDPDDDEPITPNHLLLLHNNASSSWGTFFSSDIYRKRWRYTLSISTLSFGRGGSESIFPNYRGAPNGYRRPRISKWETWS